MQISGVNNINFTSVIPIRVFDEQGEIKNPDTVKKSCEKITQILAGPARECPQYTEFIKRLTLMDPEFSAQRSWNGYCNKAEKETPSLYFKIVFDKNNQAYIFTGKDAQELSRIGREIGRAKRECNENGVKTSDRLEYMQNQYFNAIRETLSDKSRRLKEEYTSITKRKVGNFSEIQLNVSTKPNKRNPEKKDVTLNKIKFNILG